METNKIAYFAGIVDGEGCLSITRPNGKHTYIPSVIIFNTNSDIIHWVQDNFGGTAYYNQYPPSIRKMGGKPVNRWITTMNSCMDIVRLVYPYLIIKKRQADVMLRFAPTIDRNHLPNGRWAKLSDENLAIREACYWDMRALNKKGYKPEK